MKRSLMPIPWRRRLPPFLECLVPCAGAPPRGGGPSLRRAPTRRWKSPAMLSRYAHLSTTHLWKAVEGLTQAGTVTKTVTEELAEDEETQKLLKKVVSRLGLEPRALALKDQIDRFW